jgi:hypothetical protein
MFETVSNDEWPRDVVSHNRNMHGSEMMFSYRAMMNSVIVIIKECNPRDGVYNEL